jgi:signal transduction histidine kinase/GAF domain-containing protein
MTSSADASFDPLEASRSHALNEHLHDVMEALAAALTQTEIVDVVLRPALQALGAIGGAVLLVDETGRYLRLAAHQGYVPGVPIIWQDGSVKASGPANDVLRTREALYFEHAGELIALYPDLEAQTGAVAAVATAILPMFLDDRPLGSLVLDFREPHTFTPDERRFLRTLASHCAIALGRADSLRRLERQLAERTSTLLRDAQAQDVFVAFTESVGTQTDLVQLVKQAIKVLEGRFPGVSIAYYEEEDGLWKARTWSEDLAPDLAAFLAAGLPVDTPLFAEAVASRQPVFTDAWDAVQERVALTEEYGAVAGYPLAVNGELHSFLAVGLRDTRTWSQADRGLVRAVGRSLTLALERTETARQLTLQNAELQARTRALEAFAELTRDLALTTDPLLLIRRAQEMVLPMLADGAALYYEPLGDRWYNRVQCGTLHSPQLQAAVDAGLPLNETRNLLTPWTTGQPYFQAHYDQTTDRLAPNVGHIGATATLPVQVGGMPIGVLAFVLFQQRAWSSVDRVLLETAVQSLELALDLAAKTTRLDEERVALEVFTRFTETVGSETDVQALVRRAITLLEETLSVDVTYFERNGDLFKVKSWNPALPTELLARLQAGLSLTQPGLAQAKKDRQAVFEDHWDAVGRGIPEGTQHGVLAIQPFFEDREMTSVLVMGSRTSVTWSERDRGIFRAVGRSLELALDRAAKTRRLEEERTALEAFTRFTELVGSETDVQFLVRQAITLLYETCGVEGIYFERDGALFKAVVWCLQVDQTLLPRLQQGFPLQHSSIALLLRQNTAAFIDHWNDTGLLIEETNIYQAVAGYPYFVNGELERVLLIGSRTSLTWDERTKGIFRAVGRSLDLALNRARQSSTVTAQRDTLEAQTKELEGRTQELQSFSYSVSHDLRTPVRHMIGFLGLARKALDGRLDDRSARYLDVAEQAGTQMNTLIDALLDLSRAAQQTLRPGETDLNGIMAQIQEKLLPDLDTRDVRWEVVPLPAVHGDRDALMQVLTQLTENALKFTRTRDPAIIRVWAEDQGDAWGVFVQDNGLGFDPRYQDRLFNLFQRLHSADEASGTGVGLASVRRLILKHGGQVFAEGQVGEGATFGFTLPKSSPAQS